ncbi:hypothetical protein FQA39_LY10193 [Lamprigera yunnana]|nr:hypothetical protein FQA39_LY10193 [Lamprigera yunnana]
MLLEAEHQFKMTCPYEYISDERVLELLTWENTFEASECSLKSVATGNAFQSPRAKAQMGDRFDFLFCMIGHLRDPKFGALTNHSFSKFNGNPSLRPPLPIIHSDITFIDVDTGVTKAIIAGNECMEWKTAGASTMATKHLHGGKPKHILAVVGAGLEGKIHAIALQKYFNFKEVRIWNRTKSKAVDAVNTFNRGLSKKVYVVADSVQECIYNADVIVTATPAAATLVKFEWVKKGAHINAVGVNPFNTELDAATYKGSKIYCDYWEGANTELLHITALGGKIVGQVGDVIAGKIPAPGAHDTTIFQSLGMAVQDCAMARMIYDLHQKTC